MHRIQHLSKEEIVALRRARRRAEDIHVRCRCEMILLSHAGMSPPEIARRVPYGRSTVVRYIQRYQTEGLAGLFDRPRPGRPRIVTAEYERELIRIAKTRPADLGLPFTKWSTARLAEYMAERTGIRITARQVENYLKAHGLRLYRRDRRQVE